MTRLISGVILAAAALAAILFLPTFALRVLACIVAALAAHEYLVVNGITGGRANLPIAAVIVACAVTSARYVAHFEIVIAIAVALVAAGVLFGNWRLTQAATASFAGLYIGVPLGLLVATHARHGWAATLLVIGTVVVSDSAQYYTGRAFGRRPLAPAISPKKTVEGALGGILFGALFMMFAGAAVFPAAGYVRLLAGGLLVVGAGILGDLFESRLKRAAGVKDSSTLIPGHGGVLDRIDALLFAAPAFYALLRSLVP
jgi:phosphatidate cytidylyltransferase